MTIKPLLLLSALLIPLCSFAADDRQAKSSQDDNSKEAKELDADWDVEAAHGPQFKQKIDATEGTWMNLDVSPDGAHVVFDFLGDIYTMPIESDAARVPRKLTSGVAWDMQPRFSPDGKWIAFTSDRTGENKKAGDNIWYMDVGGGNVTQVTRETYRLLNGPAWTPDSQYIVARKHFTSRRSLGAGEMWLYHRSAAQAKSTSGVQLTKRPTDQKDVNEPIFSPDGKYLYYSEDVWPGQNFEYDKDSNKQIYVIKRLTLETGKTETYISGPGGACRPTPSPDGKTIAFVRRIGAKTGLHVFDSESGAVRLVYDQLERDMQEAWAIHGVYPSFAWTPDGESIVIWAKGKIRQIDVASGEARELAFHIKDTRKMTKAVRFPIEVAPDEFDVKMLKNVQVTPDGERVVYQALGYIYVRGLEEGAKARRLTAQTNHFEFMPQISRDGRYVVYVAWNDDQLGSIRIASIDPQAAESWKVTSDPGHYSNPVFSPDGETIVYERNGGGHLTSPLWSHERGIFRISARGGDPSLVSASGSKPRFGKQPDRVFFQRVSSEKEADNRGLYSIGLDGQQERQHYTSTWATDYVMSPDENWVAFVERFNVYLAPFIHAGHAVKVAPKASNLPVFKVSESAGEWIQFSADGARLHWALGATLYSTNVKQHVETLDTKGEDDSSIAPNTSSIGFKTNYQVPDTTVALIGGRIVTMNGDEVIEDGTVLVKENRIVAVGPRRDIDVPEGAIQVKLNGRTVLPGFVDTHAHGAQGENGITPQQSWVDLVRLAFGVTTIHDPSHNTHAIFSASEMAKAGHILAPRTFSTGTILYGASGAYKAEVHSLDDAKFHLERMQAVGAFSVKSYNQPRRDQRQQVLRAARELGMMVVPEGGSTFMHNMTMIVDGHTGIEHTLPVQTAYDDVYDLWRNTRVGYTPTLSVAYGGISGEQYWYQVDDLWLHPRLKEFIPPHVLNPRSRRRNKSPDEDYNHMRVAEIAKRRVDDGGMVQAGGHGQLNGICTHWEMWSFVQGGMTPMEALRCGTLFGAMYVGLDKDLGSIEAGKLADLIVIQKGFDPTKEIRHSEKIEYVVANGRVFEAQRMNELGSSMPRKPFYWSQVGYGGVGSAWPTALGCSCQRGR